jgi:hypothetical protein
VHRTDVGYGSGIVRIYLHGPLVTLESFRKPSFAPICISQSCKSGM